MMTILSDNDFMMEVKELINRAANNGYAKTYVLKVISNTWKDVIPNNEQEEGEFELTDDEKEFFDKVDKFFAEFGEDLVKLTVRYIKNLTWPSVKKDIINLNSPDKKRKFTDSLIMLTKCIYCIFSRKTTFTRKDIQQFGQKIFNCKFEICDPYILNFALDDLFFADGQPTRKHKTEETEEIEEKPKLQKTEQDSKK